jgi:hypothetical protein
MNRQEKEKEKKRENTSCEKQNGAQTVKNKMQGASLFPETGFVYLEKCKVP